MNRSIQTWNTAYQIFILPTAGHQWAKPKLVTSHKKGDQCEPSCGTWGEVKRSSTPVGVHSWPTWNILPKVTRQDYAYITCILTCTVHQVVYQSYIVCFVQVSHTTALLRSGSGTKTPCCRRHRKKQLQHRIVNLSVAYSTSLQSSNLFCFWVCHAQNTRGFRSTLQYKGGKPRNCLIHKLFKPTAD